MRRLASRARVQRQLLTVCLATGLDRGGELTFDSCTTAAMATTKATCKEGGVNVAL